MKNLREGNPTIYIISGPCGTGKSTITRALSQKLNDAVLIEGDSIFSMMQNEEHPLWEEKLAIVWKNIFSLTRNFIHHNMNVVIDYVVEDELELILKNFSDLKVNLKYIVLRADEQTLNSRLHHRGDPDLVDRSLFLLKKLETTAANKQHLYDTTNKNPEDIVSDLLKKINLFDLDKK